MIFFYNSASEELCSHFFNRSYKVKDAVLLAGGVIKSGTRFLRKIIPRRPFLLTRLGATWKNATIQFTTNKPTIAVFEGRYAGVICFALETELLFLLFQVQFSS